MSEVNKIDSNNTGLRAAEETTIGVLPAAASQIWEALEPNSYDDFGVTITTVARKPISASRQNKKGVTTDFDASGGFNTDITQTNLQSILQGLFFADLRKKAEFTGVITSVATADDSYNAASGLDVYRAGDLIFVTGMAQSANNGLKRVVTAIATKITVSENLVNETPPVTGTKLVQVGFQFDVSDATISSAGSLPVLGATTKNLTQFGLIPGEWVYIGGDQAGEQFTTTADNGFARVRAVAASTISFDKTAGTMNTDNGNLKTIRIFFGRVLKNETGTDIVRRSYTLERKLGANDTSDLTLEQAEYLKGAVPNEMTMNVPTADKVTVDLKFVALDGYTLDENDLGANKLLSSAAVAAGSALNAPEIVEADAFNTSSDVSRIKLSTFTEGTTNPSALFAFVQELKLTVTNHIEPNKAVGVTGAFDVSTGNFDVSGNITAYFANVSSVAAVRNNADITLDAHFVKANAGYSFDLPLIALGGGRPKVEQDKPITLPLDNPAADGAKIHPTLNHTLLMMFWDYLPDAAE
jgi:hypothetical protein